ncbi:MAG: TetR/AcrR family transcriptional regulator [Micrococcales bacterium]|nr:TetR/AcrR family transcriptional regulator [Micrococcales bacterium]
MSTEITADVAVASTRDAGPGNSGKNAGAFDEGLRERKKRETRVRLHRAALDLVVEHGLDHATVEQIAAAAQVSARTFFNYYPSKEAAVVGVDPNLPERLVALFVARPAGEDALTSLEAVMRDWIAPLVADPTLRAQRIRAFAAAPDLIPTAAGSASRGVERHLVDAVARRLQTDGHADPWPTLLTGCALAVLRSAFATPGAPLQETVTTGFRLLREGFGAAMPASSPEPPT